MKSLHESVEYRIRMKITFRCTLVKIKLHGEKSKEGKGSE